MHMHGTHIWRTEFVLNKWTVQEVIVFMHKYFIILIYWQWSLTYVLVVISLDFKQGIWKRYTFLDFYYFRSGEQCLGIKPSHI
jgi:hypothetical protein